jgi:hypothetical protein
VEWLAVSLVLSVVLTVLLNVGLRLFPGLGRRFAEWMAALVRPDVDDAEDGHDDRRVRVVVPWKAMIVASVVLTLVLNIVLRIG